MPTASTTDNIPNCELSIEKTNAVIAAQNSLIREQIMQDIAYSEPFSATIKGTTINLNNRGESIRSLISNRVFPAWSRVSPQFTRFTDTCNSVPTADDVGQTEYSTYMESLTGRGPSFCVRESIHTVLNSLKGITEGLKTAIRELKGFDIRNAYLKRSGVKFVAKTGLSLDTILTGSRKAVSQSFYPTLPDSTITLQTLIRLASKMHTVLGVEKFSSGMDAHYLVIGGDELIERIRNDSKVENAIFAQTQGGYADGNNAIKSYPWLDVQHRGLRFGLDYQPLRYNVLDGDGQPSLIEPEIRISSDYGYDSQPNPDWENATYEIGFIIGKDAFEYITLQSYTGEGTWKWSPQFTMGDLQWHNVKDMTCNFKGDTGFHWYEMVRAINPVKPHAVMPFAYKRCPADLGLEECTVTSFSS